MKTKAKESKKRGIVAYSPEANARIAGMSDEEYEKLEETFEKIWNDNDEEENEMKRIPEPKERPLEPPEPSVVCECGVCGQDIYEDETYWDIEGDVVCNDCLRDYAEEYFSCYQKKR